MSVSGYGSLSKIIAEENALGEREIERQHGALSDEDFLNFMLQQDPSLGKSSNQTDINTFINNNTLVDVDDSAWAGVNIFEDAPIENDNLYENDSDDSQLQAALVPEQVRCDLLCREFLCSLLPVSVC